VAPNTILYSSIVGGTQYNTIIRKTYVSGGINT